MKPKSVTRTLFAEMLDTARNVGRTPSTTQGWRPTSGTIQPASAAIQGNGKENTSTQSNQRALRIGPVDMRVNARPNKRIKKKPHPTMIRNDQKRSATGGTMLQAAFLISSPVAFSMSERIFLRRSA